MLSVVIAAEQPQWPVVSTLAALVPGAAAGLVRDVVLIDRHGDKETAEIADIAGCDLHVIKTSRGAALAEGAKLARSTWILFLAPGAIVEPGWTDEAAQFIQATEHAGVSRAATFLRAHDAYAPVSLGERLKTIVTILSGSRPAEGLLIAKAFYDKLGGHRDVADPERDLVSRIGRRHCATLRTRLTLPA